LMTRVCAVAGMLMLVLGTGCPVGGEEGVLHQAMLMDEIQRLAKDSCQPAAVKKECGPNYEKCMESCREEMKRRTPK
jgi:hypothetical protein